MSKPTPQPERAPLDVVVSRGSVHRERLDELERDIDELRNANAELRASLYRNDFRVL